MKIKSSIELVKEALKVVKTISPEEAFNLKKDNKCNLIDVRDIRELKKEGEVEDLEERLIKRCSSFLPPGALFSRERTRGLLSPGFVCFH